MAAQDPRPEYERRQAAWSAAIARSESRHLLVSNFRLAAVALAVAVAWLAFVRGALSPAWTLMPVLAFLVLLVVHARVLNARDHALRARSYYERGFSRLDGSWTGAGPDGARFLDGHPYARDLDLFGPGSLFQLLNTARTESGEDTLADWLRAPASPAEIEARQSAVAELRDRLDFREALAVFAADARVTRTGRLARWATATPEGFGPGHARAFAASAVVTAILVTLMFASTLPLAMVLA